MLEFNSDYPSLKRIDIFVKTYKELGQDFPLFIYFFRRIKEERLDKKQDIIDLLQNRNNLKDIDRILELYHNHISELKTRKSALEQEIK